MAMLFSRWSHRVPAVAGVALLAAALGACNSSSTTLASATATPCAPVPTTPPVFSLVTPANGATGVSKAAQTISFSAKGNVAVLAATLTTSTGPVALGTPAPATAAPSPSGSPTAPTPTPVPAGLYVSTSPALAGSTAYTLHVNAIDNNSCSQSGQDFAAGAFTTGP